MLLAIIPHCMEKENESKKEIEKNPHCTRGLKSEFRSMDRHILSMNSKPGRSYYKQRKRK
jgi:hypothetical protein